MGKISDFVSNWKKFEIELARAVAILKEHQRESDERWVRIAELRAENERLKTELERHRLPPLSIETKDYRS